MHLQIEILASDPPIRVANRLEYLEGVTVPAKLFGSGVGLKLQLRGVARKDGTQRVVRRHLRTEAAGALKMFCERILCVMPPNSDLVSLLNSKLGVL